VVPAEQQAQQEGWAESDLPPASRPTVASRKPANQENDGNLEKQIHRRTIIGFIRQAEAGLPIKELCRKGGFSDAMFSNGVPSLAAWMYLMPAGCVNSKARTPPSINALHR
jgi:hypothetical protein